MDITVLMPSYYSTTLCLVSLPSLCVTNIVSKNLTETMWLDDTARQLKHTNVDQRKLRQKQKQQTNMPRHSISFTFVNVRKNLVL